MQQDQGIGDDVQGLTPKKTKRPYASRKEGEKEFMNIKDTASATFQGLKEIRKKKQRDNGYSSQQLPRQGQKGKVQLAGIVKYVDSIPA